MFYYDMGDHHVVGSSPEILARLEGDIVTVRPIAGTRPRGKDAQQDAALAEELLADPKELAEHLMLIDLGRNDIGRVAEHGTVKLTDKMVIERYSHVMHIVSNVEAKLQQGLSAMDVLKATFPAGTVSGAAKVRAMEIIDELEPTQARHLRWRGRLPRLQWRHGRRHRPAYCRGEGPSTVRAGRCWHRCRLRARKRMAGDAEQGACRAARSRDGAGRSGCRSASLGR